MAGFRILTALVLIGVQTPALANNSCGVFSGSSERVENFARPKLKVDGTDGLIAYLSDLLESQIIGDNELIRLIEGLEKGEFTNPFAEEQAWISSAAQIHREEMQVYIKGTELDQGRLLEWSKGSLKEKARVKVRREETRQETQEIYHKMEFHPVPRGTFQMGGVPNQVTVNLTHPIEVMSTAVTQKQWVELMGENPSEFVDGEHTIIVNIQGQAIKMQPDNPVEQMTWWSILEFANRLSVKMGFKPAYDLSGIQFEQGTSSEAGTWIVESGEIGINAPDGDIYQAEGFRLPTEAESEYMLRAAGKAFGGYHFGNYEADLKDYAWYKSNSDQKIHPVAQLKPLSIDGKDFYDLHGNVWERTHDWYDGALKGGDNPQGAQTGIFRVLRGGSYLNDAFSQRSDSRNFLEPKYRSTGVGFRLVRTLK